MPAVLAPADVRGRVLIADDDGPLVRAWERSLRKDGFGVASATHGRAAIDLLRTQEVDALVCDINMPGMDGLALLREVRRHDLDLPVVLVTAGPALETAIQAVEYGALRYLQKPVDLRELEQVVSLAVRMRRMARLKRQALEMLGVDAHQPSDRAGLEVGLGRAFASLFMAYQPIVSLRRRTVRAYEGLLRSREPGLLGANDILRAAERLGRVPDLGRAVRFQAARDLRELPEGIDLFVNLHSLDLSDEALYAADAPLSTESGRVVLEITERVSLEAVADFGARVSRLKAMGFRIALDDLGAGFAGLNLLARLEPHVVKIDMALVRDLHRYAVKRRLIRSVVELCRDLDMEVVAEGVETIEERDALVDLGVDLLQGYLFARPARAFATVAF